MRGVLGVYVFFLLLLFANAEYVKYKDPKQPVAVRVKDLLSRMTLEEKIGQMVQIDRTVATAQTMKDYSIGTVLITSFNSFLTHQRQYDLGKFLVVLCNVME